jgi:hypothetical protein
VPVARRHTRRDAGYPAGASGPIAEQSDWTGLTHGLAGAKRRPAQR